MRVEPHYILVEARVLAVAGAHAAGVVGGRPARGPEGATALAAPAARPGSPAEGLLRGSGLLLRLCHTMICSYYDF